MKKITEIIIVFNPNSTGNGQKNAMQLRDELKKRLPASTRMTLTKTKYAGHAEKIAREAGSAHDVTLIVSSSGDGGYHEVINGALNNTVGTIITGLIPSGNANDHFHAVTNNNLVDDIVSGTYQKIDGIKVSAHVKGKEWSRFAHSYVGIGLSPSIGRELTKTKLNFFNEKWVLLKFLFTYSYVKIIVNNRPTKYSSIIFSNVDTMSKVIRLSNNASLKDGKFEINIMKYNNKLKLLLYLLVATTKGLEEHTSKQSFSFTTINTLPIQLDGEVFTLDSSTDVRIESIHTSLRCIV